MRLLVTDAAAQPPRQATAWLIMTFGRMKLWQKIFMISPLLIASPWIGRICWDHYSQYERIQSKIYTDQILIEHGIDRIVCRETVWTGGPFRSNYVSESATFGRPTGRERLRIILESGEELRPLLEKNKAEKLEFIPAGELLEVRSGEILFYRASKQKTPNKAVEPTTMRVTDPANAGSAPRMVAAHL